MSGLTLRPAQRVTRDSRAQTAAEDKQSGHVVTVINCYFMSQGGAMFRAQIESFPYLYLQIKVSVYPQGSKLLSC